MNIVSTIHRFLGETLLLIALIGVILAIIELVRKQELAQAENIFGIAYAGLLDLQALLGIVQFIYILIVTGPSLALSSFILPSAPSPPLAPAHHGTGLLQSRLTDTGPPRSESRLGAAGAAGAQTAPEASS